VNLCSVAALNLSAKGQAHVKWTENISERDSNGKTRLRTVYYTGKEVYFHVTYSILEKSKGCMSPAVVDSTLHQSKLSRETRKRM
jgi:hypothetical protein